jgi:translocation-and-assembly-module (TAM) inner membrane subunit TamB-like protein
LLLLIVTLGVLVNLTPVQNYLAREAAGMLSRKLKTEVTVEHVRIDFLNHISVEVVYIGDQAHDTLLYAGQIRVRMTDWFIFKDKPVFHYLALNNTYIHLYRPASSKTWNYDFIADAFSTAKKDTGAGKPFEFDLKKVELGNVRFHMDDKWGGEDEDYDAGSLVINSDGIDFTKKVINVEDIVAKNCNVVIREFPAGHPRYLRKQVADTFDTKPFNPGKWSVNVGSVSLDGCQFHLGMNSAKPVPGFFDYNHIDATNIKAVVTAATIRGDTIRGNLDHFETKERSGFAIKSMSCKATVSPIASICENLLLETNYSKLQDYYAMHYKHFPNFTSYIDSVVMVGRLKKSSVDVRDIAYFAPELAKFPKIVLEVNGEGSGTVADLHTHDINVTDGTSIVKGNLSLKGLPDIFKTYITFSNGELMTSGNGILRYVPGLRNSPDIALEQLTYAYFRGKYEGYIENFSVNGAINTNLGAIGTDIKMKIPGFSSNNSVYSGTLVSDNFQLGPLLRQPILGAITLKEDISGQSFNPDRVQLNIDGTVKEISLKGYPYRNIITHGTLAKKQFKGTLLVDDPNLGLEFDGGFDYNNKDIKVAATAHLLGCNFKALNLTADSITASADFDLNCTGSNIDNFSGYAKLNNIDMRRNSHKLAIDSVFINSSGESGHKLLTIQSNDLVATIKGDYQLSKMPASIQYYLSSYLPNYIKTPVKVAPDQNFEFTIKTGDIDSIFAVTLPIIRGFDSSDISGALNTNAQKLLLIADIPYGSVGKVHMSHISITGLGNLNTLGLNANIGNVAIGDSFLNGSLSLTTTVSNDSVAFSIATTTSDTSSAITLNGQVIARKDSLFLTILPSQFYLNQLKWDIAGGSKVVYSDKYLLVQGLTLSSGLQKISASTELNSGDKSLVITTDNLDLGQFGSWAGLAMYQPDGRVNGTVKIDKIFQDLHISADIKATGVKLGTDTVGTINLIGDYDGDKKTISLDPRTGIYRNGSSVVAAGIISFDSATHQKLDGSIQFNNTPVVWASPFLIGIMSRLSGTLNGKINFGGSAYDPVINGDVELANAGMRIDYMGCNYTIPSANIHVDNRRISFGNVQVLDGAKNTATLSGHFSHNMFRDMRMHLSVRSKKIEVMNLTSSDNSLFYGNLVASMDSFTIRGPFNNISINIYNIAAASKSRFYIPVQSGGDLGAYDYVSFKTYGKTLDKSLSKSRFRIHINVDASLNTLAEMHIVLDPASGDEIMARGNGRIQLDIPPDNDMQITGPYNIDNGVYTYTFKSLFIRRQFILNSGSTISFNGPFGETNLNVDAVYSAKARLYDLLTETDKTTLTGSDLTDAQTPQWVNVILHMNGSLKSPLLTFDLDLEDKHSQSTLAYRKLTLINSDDRQKTEQVSALLLVGSFIPSDGIGSGTVTTGAINNFSQMVSSSASTGITALVNKITGDKQLNVDVKYENYNYSDIAIGATNRSQVKVGVNKNFLNDRLTVEVGSTSDWGRPTSSTTASTFNITGDFRIQYLLSHNSGLRLNAFRTSDYDVTLDRDIQRNGLGISWRKSFDNLGEFFRGNKYAGKQRALEDKSLQNQQDTVKKASGTE